MLAFACSSDASAADERDPPLRLGLEASVGWGPIDGYIQIPKGGAAGTTSPDRPRLSELDYDREIRFDLEGSVAWGAHGLLLRSAFLDLSSSARLEVPLVHHATSFDRGSEVRSKLRLNHHRASYRYDISLIETPDHRVTLGPSVGFGLLDFELDLAESAARGTRSSRAFLEGFATAGLAATHHWSNGLTTTARIDGFPPVDGMAFVLGASLTARLRVLEAGQLLDGLGASVLAGVGYERIEFEDSQPTPNHIDFEMGPTFIAGVEFIR